MLNLLAGMLWMEAYYHGFFPSGVIALVLMVTDKVLDIVLKKKPRLIQWELPSRISKTQDVRQDREVSAKSTDT